MATVNESATSSVISPPWIEAHTQVWKRARQIPMLPGGTESIDGPGPEPEMPKFSLVQILIPLASLALMGGLYAIFFKGRSSYLLLMIPTTVLSVGGTAGKYLAGKKTYLKRLESYKQDYRNYLTWQCDHLDRLLEKQRAALVEINPPACEWLRQVEAGSTQVWERCAADPDFLCLRVGTGTIPASFNVVPPSVSGALDVLTETAVVVARIMKHSPHQ